MEHSTNSGKANDPGESRIEKSSYEIGILYLQDGSTIELLDNNEYSINIPADVIRKMENAVFTHNHPNGTTFSKMDFSTLVLSNLSILRATTKNGTFQLRKVSDPNSRLNFANDYESAAQNYIKNVTDHKWEAAQKEKLSDSQLQKEADRLNRSVDNY